MSDRSFLLECTSGSLEEVEQALRARLPAQLDVALIPLTEHTALLRGHLADAFRAANPGVNLARLLRSQGVTAQPISTERTLARLQSRSPIELPARKRVAAARIEGFDWHLGACRIPTGWNRVGGPDGINWSLRVGQIDTGFTHHPCLGFKTAIPWLQVADSRTFVPQNEYREDWLTQEPGGGIDPLSGASAGHGTRIAGTICGHDPTASGGPFFGAAPRVPLVMTRITDSVIVSDRQDQMVEALRYLTCTARVDAINISLGFLPPGITTSDLKAALNEAYEAGVIVVCAAGNYVDPVIVPARLNRTLAVAGVTRQDVPWSGSSFGPQVDLSAPANELRRGNVKRGTTRPKYSYEGGGDGTSYATAMTTAAAALWLQYRGQAIAAAYRQPWQRVAAFRMLARNFARVPQTLIDGTVLWQPGSFGTGILDVDALLGAELPAPTVLTPEPLP